MVNGVVVGFRDPHDIWPLVYGKRDNENGSEFMLTSESIALDALGFELLGDCLVLAGLFILIEKDKFTESNVLKWLVIQLVFLSIFI
ncbi:hypothetical protein [Coxiella-like endosymbiont]|uniref:hypothetical protein n=1 Tax=Coxiella-like endosymbiont TaxID=1592897 RepID=UPI00272CB583|nr:hypothetical protein [Coxiella-like endosymbiont]